MPNKIEEFIVRDCPDCPGFQTPNEESFTTQPFCIYGGHPKDNKPNPPSDCPLRKGEFTIHTTVRLSK